MDMETPQNGNGQLTDAQIREMTRVFVAYINHHITLEELVTELRRSYDPKAAYLADNVIHTNGELVRLDELAEEADFAAMVAEDDQAFEDWHNYNETVRAGLRGVA